MSWRNLNRFGNERGGAFYLTALAYASTLWCSGHSARAILALNRGLYADLSGDEPELADWPLPYPAYRWLLENDPGDSFLGNPRISFQHQAGRMRGARLGQRIARAWACWHLVRLARPELPGDMSHEVDEPARDDTRRQLERHGIPGEAEVWLRAMNS